MTKMNPSYHQSASVKLIKMITSDNSEGSPWPKGTICIAGDAIVSGLQPGLLSTSPLFSNKSYLTNSRITLLENGAILSEEAKVANTFNEFFSNVIKELKIEQDDTCLLML